MDSRRHGLALLQHQRRTFAAKTKYEEEVEERKLDALIEQHFGYNFQV
jgi:hypothetical protein